MPVAGIGSRFIALLVDYLIWGAGIAFLMWIFAFLLPGLTAFNRLSAQWATALYLFLIFLFNWGYFTLFEAFWNGRTPGKRIAGIRVIQRSGRAIGLFESMARNFVRFIDQIPFFYAVGAIAIFVTRDHQRLGDLAAGTLVVRDRIEEAPISTEVHPHLHRQYLCARRPHPRAARRLLAARSWNRQTLRLRSAGPREFLRPPPRHASRYTPGPRPAHRRSHPGQVCPRTPARRQHRNIFGNHRKTTSRRRPHAFLRCPAVGVTSFSQIRPGVHMRPGPTSFWPLIVRNGEF